MCAGVMRPQVARPFVPTTSPWQPCPIDVPSGPLTRTFPPAEPVFEGSCVGPSYECARGGQIYDTLIALILPIDCFCYTISTLILKDFVWNIRSVLWQLMWRLSTPIACQGVIAVGIYHALQAWNCFLFPSTFTQSSEVRVLLPSTWSFQGERTVCVPAGFGSEGALNVAIAGPIYLWAAPTPKPVKAGFGKGPPLCLIY
jgi:hypothetical protein